MALFLLDIHLLTFKTCADGVDFFCINSCRIIFPEREGKLKDNVRCFSCIIVLFFHGRTVL